jgi:hypothetical protein
MWNANVRLHMCEGLEIRIDFRNAGSGLLLGDPYRLRQGTEVLLRHRLQKQLLIRWLCVCSSLQVSAFHVRVVASVTQRAFWFRP